MVSIIQRSEFLNQLESDDYILALSDFLYGEEIIIEFAKPISNINNATVSALKAIQDNNFDQFKEIYNLLSLRKPNPDSDWIFNDVFIFSFTLGICKFKLEHHWLNKLLELRMVHSQSNNKLVTQTFIDILKGNLENSENFQALMLVFKYYLELPIHNEKKLNQIYIELSKEPFPFHKSSFLNLISLRANDIIILSKGLVDLEHQHKLINFMKSFTKRIYQVSFFCWIILLILVFRLSIWLFFTYINIDPQNQVRIDKIISFFPYVSTGSLVGLVFGYRKKIIGFIEKIFFAIFGYNVDLTLNEK